MARRYSQIRYVQVDDDDDDAKDDDPHSASTCIPRGWHVEWPDLDVQASAQGNGRSGLGVFARRRLQPWEFIPIFGRTISPSEYHALLAQGLATHVSFAGDSLIDGHPRLHPWRGVGGRGLYISSIVNEPTRRKPNLIMRGDKLIVATPIAAGEELLVAYGPEYTRGYNVSKYTLAKQRYLALER